MNDYIYYKIYIEMSILVIEIEIKHQNIEIIIIRKIC